MSNNPETKGLSSFDFFTIGFGAIVGVGWALSLNNWMANSGGPIPAAIGYLMVLVILTPVALCYCELTPMLPVAGGGAAFAYRAFGETASIISGWAAFGAFIFMLPWEAIYVTDVLSMIIPGVRGDTPLYTLNGGDVYLGGLIIGLVVTAIITWANAKGAVSAAWFQKVMTVILLAAAAIGIISGIFKFDFDNLKPIYENVNDANHNSIFGGILAIMTSAPFFMCGFETIPQAVEDASGDVKDVGKAVVMAVAVAALFYALALFVLGAAAPWQDFLDVDSPAVSNLLLNAYGGAIGRVLYIVILIGTLAGLLTTWNGFYVAAPRLLMCLARANLVPKALAKQNPKNGVPTNGIILCAVLSAAGPFLGVGLIEPLTSFSGTACLTSWAITCFCLIRLRKTEPDLPRPYKIVGGTPTAWFGGIVMTVIWVMFFIPTSPCYMGTMAMIIFLVWMAIGIILYLGNSGQRRKVPKEERAAAMFATMGVSTDLMDTMGSMDSTSMLNQMYFTVMGLLPILLFIVIVANSLVADKVDKGSMAYVLSTPTKRSAVAITQAIYLVVAPLIIIGIVCCVRIGSSFVLFDEVNVEQIVVLYAGMYILIEAIAGLCYLGSCVFSQSKKSMAFGGGLTVWFFLASLLGMFGSQSLIDMGIGVEALGVFNKLTLIGLFDINAIGTIGSGAVDYAFVWKFGVLAAVAVVCYVAGAIRFQKKDLPL